jgi:D-alanine-D-alanine ligase-like ATP-grasp enzyme
MTDIFFTHICETPNILASTPVVRIRFQQGFAGNAALSEEKCLKIAEISDFGDFTTWRQKQPDTLSSSDILASLYGYLIHRSVSLADPENAFLNWRKQADDNSFFLTLGVAHPYKHKALLFALIEAFQNCLADEFKPAQLLRRFHERQKALRLHPMTVLMLAAADRKEIPWIYPPKQGDYIRLGYGRDRILFSHTFSNSIGVISDKISANKQLTNELLIASGLPASHSVMVSSNEHLSRISHQIGFPLVVKPLDGMRGEGVTLNIKNAHELTAAYKSARRLSRPIIAEKFIKGDDYRFLILKGKCVAAVRRSPPQVIGDGRSTLSELMQQVNKSDPRRLDSEVTLKALQPSPAKKAYLATQGTDFSYVPEKNQLVLLHEMPNLLEGGNSEDVMDIIHPDNIKLAEQTASVCGLDIAGIDFMSVDISQPFHHNDAKIIEVNTLPSLRPVCAPDPARSDFFHELFIDAMRAHLTSESVQVYVAVGEGAEDHLNSLADTLSEQGLSVAVVTDSRSEIDGCPIHISGKGPARAQTLLYNPMADAILIQEDLKHVVTLGLGYRFIDHLFVGHYPDDAAQNAALDLLGHETRIDVTISSNNTALETWAGSPALSEKLQILYAS